MRLIDADNVRNLFDAEFKETRKLILAGETHWIIWQKVSQKLTE